MKLRVAGGCGDVVRAEEEEAAEKMQAGSGVQSQFFCAASLGRVFRKLAQTLPKTLVRTNVNV